MSSRSPHLPSWAPDLYVVAAGLPAARVEAVEAWAAHLACMLLELARALDLDPPYRELTTCVARITADTLGALSDDPRWSRACSSILAIDSFATQAGLDADAPLYATAIRTLIADLPADAVLRAPRGMCPPPRFTTHRGTA